MAPVYAQYETLQKQKADLEAQIVNYQTREDDWAREKATLVDKVSQLESSVAAAVDRVKPLEVLNQRKCL